MGISDAISSRFDEMMTFLFWNLKSKNMRMLTNLVNQHKVDVLILAECPLLAGEILASLNVRSAEYFFAPSDCGRIQLFTRFKEDYVVPVT